MTTLIYDGDEILYQSCSGCLREEEWDGWHTWACDAKEVKSVIKYKVLQAQEQTGATEVLFALSDHDSNFRKRLAPTYKGHRKTVKKPLAYFACEEWLEEEYDCYKKPGLEADDVMGLMSADVDYIVSSDKDMKTLPGVTIVSPYHGLTMIGELTEAEANRFWLYQTLTGDSVDGYSGAPRVGKVTADKILADVYGAPLEEQWEAVVAAFRRGGKDEEYALTQARLARILRPGEYSDRDREPHLWSPN